MADDESSWSDDQERQRENGTHTKGGRCPFCDEDLDDDLPHHLPECPTP